MEWTAPCAHHGEFKAVFSNFCDKEDLLKNQPCLVEQRVIFTAGSGCAKEAHPAPPTGKKLHSSPEVKKFKPLLFSV